MDTGIELIAKEREKQINKHGYTPEHDSHYDGPKLLLAALSYLNTALYGENVGISDWPFGRDYFKPGTEIVETLSKVGAFVAAEIDRLKYVNNDK